MDVCEIPRRKGMNGESLLRRSRRELAFVRLKYQYPAFTAGRRDGKQSCRDKVFF
jgi:hypothetical protein